MSTTPLSTQSTSPTLATVEKTAAVVIPVASNVVRTVKHYLENVGISLNGQEMKPLVDSIIHLVESGGELHPDVANANAAREAEAASILKQAADAIEKNRVK